MYKFDELSEEAKKIAIENHNDDLVENIDWEEPILEEWKEKLERVGYNDFEIGYSGFWSQGDGASFTYSGIDVNNKFVKRWLFSGCDQKIVNTLYDGLKTGDFDLSLKGLRHGNYLHERSIVNYLDIDFAENIDTDWFENFDAKVQANADKFQIEISVKIYRALEKYYNELHEDEAVIEEIESNDLNFNDDGSDYNPNYESTLDDENKLTFTLGYNENTEENYSSHLDYIQKLITFYLGEKEVQRGSADWGGLDVWSIKSEDNITGLFMVVNNDDETVVVMYREVWGMTEENMDTDLKSFTWEDDSSLYRFLKQLAHNYNETVDLLENMLNSKNQN